MNDETISNLKSLRDSYQRIRNEKMATGVTIHTLIGDYPIKNPQVIVTVLDLLIREANEQIRQLVNQ